MLDNKKHPEQLQCKTNLFWLWRPKQMVGECCLPAPSFITLKLINKFFSITSSAIYCAYDQSRKWIQEYGFGGFAVLCLSMRQSSEEKYERIKEANKLVRKKERMKAKKKWDGKKGETRTSKQKKSALRSPLYHSFPFSIRPPDWCRPVNAPLWGETPSLVSFTSWHRWSNGAVSEKWLPPRPRTHTRCPSSL